MALKIAKGLQLIKATNKAKLFQGSTKFWLPNAAIVECKLYNGSYSVVAESWFNTPPDFQEVSLSNLLQQKPPADLKWSTGIDEDQYPADLVQIQQEAVTYSTKLTRALIWLWTGCGKTKIGIEIANTLYKHHKIKRLYWITPQYSRALHQLNQSFSKWLNPHIQIYIVSINWFSYNQDAGITPNDCVIIDECHRIKNGIIANNENPDCKLANNIRISIFNAGAVYGLTADSCTNGILDLFGIFFCLDKSIIIQPGKKAHHYLKVKGDKVLGLKSMLQFLHQVSPYIFHKNRADYDARQSIYKEHALLLSQQQSQSMNNLYTRANQFTTRNQSIVDVFTAMVSSAYRCGGAQLKIQALQSILQAIPATDQVIIFGFTVSGKFADISIIRQATQAYSCLELHGNHTEADNALVVHLFRNNKAKILIASYGCGAELLDFPNANHVILFGHSLNPIHRKQGIGRIDRLTQTKQTYVHNLYISNSVEGYVNHLFQKKADLSADVSVYLKNNANTLNNELH